MIPTLLMLLLFAAFVCTIVAFAKPDKRPLPIPLLLICVAEFVAHWPR